MDFGESIHLVVKRCIVIFWGLPNLLEWYPKDTVLNLYDYIDIVLQIVRKTGDLLSREAVIRGMRLISC